MLAQPDGSTVIGDFARNNTVEESDRDTARHSDTVKMSVAAGEYFVSFYSGETLVEKYKISHVIGGLRRQVYLTVFPNGAYFVLPVQWNVQAGNWSPYDDGENPLPGGDWFDARQSWQTACAKCHVTGFQENVRPGGFDSSWSEDAIGCEACHGPGAEHARTNNAGENGALFNPGGFFDGRRAMAVCGRCHARGRSVDGKYAYPAAYEPGADLDRQFTAAAPGDGALFWPDGSARANHLQAIEFKASIMAQHGVKCWSCHDPHKASDGNDAGLRVSGNALCRACHATGRGGAGSIHGVHAYGDCQACHLPKTVGTPAGESLGSHTFNASLPAATESLGGGDPGKQPNSCSLCHYHARTPVADLAAAYDTLKKEALGAAHFPSGRKP